MTLDTIVIDTDACRVFLSWRIVIAQASQPATCVVRWPLWLTARFGIDVEAGACEQRHIDGMESAVLHG